VVPHEGDSEAMAQAAIVPTGARTPRPRGSAGEDSGGNGTVLPKDGE